MTRVNSAGNTTLTTATKILHSRMAAAHSTTVPGPAPSTGAQGAAVEEDPGPRFPEVGRAIGRVMVAAGFAFLLWLVAHLAVAGMRTMSHRLLGAIGLGLGLVIGGAAWGN